MKHLNLLIVVNPLLLSVIFSMSANQGIAQTIPNDSLYFGQKPPGDSAVVFAPGKVSIPGRDVPCISFSPDGKSAVFYVGFWPDPGTPYTLITEYANNRWSAPVPASFTTNRTTGEPFFSSDGK